MSYWGGRIKKILLLSGAKAGQKRSSLRKNDPLNRRHEGGQLRGFDADYYAERKIALGPIMEKISREGNLISDYIYKESLARFDERVVEYPVALSFLLDLKTQARRRLLDVGCVLNNSIISGYVKNCASKVFLWNSSLEKPVYSGEIAYVISDLRKPFLPEEMQFDLVTCLSTIEHTGMDNTRYGGHPAEFQGEISDPERFALDGVRNLVRYVAVGGRLLVSVPYGPFEFLYQSGFPDRPIYYTFDRKRLNRLVSSLQGFEVTVIAYRVLPGCGWVPAELDEDIEMLRHADGCAAAGGVAFIEAIRK